MEEWLGEGSEAGSKGGGAVVGLGNSSAFSRESRMYTNSSELQNEARRQNTHEEYKW